MLTAPPQVGREAEIERKSRLAFIAADADTQPTSTLETATGVAEHIDT
jgi:hypothetical protein